ncbi:transient receptor potential cation channel subfamily M member 3, partial [Biomphalaria pfeifferi]
SAIKTNEEEAEELWHRQFMSFTCEHSILMFMIPLSFLLPQDENSRRYPFDLEEQDLEEMIKLASIETEQRDMYLKEVEDIKQNTMTLATPSVVPQ